VSAESCRAFAPLHCAFPAVTGSFHDGSTAYSVVQPCMAAPLLLVLPCWDFQYLHPFKSSGETSCSIVSAPFQARNHALHATACIWKLPLVCRDPSCSAPRAALGRLVLPQATSSATDRGGGAFRKAPDSISKKSNRTKDPLPAQLTCFFGPVSLGCCCRYVCAFWSAQTML
jgi:hypothetical protein